MTDQLILIPVSGIGALLTFIVNVRLKQGPVKASAYLSFGVALLFYLFPHATTPLLTQKFLLLFSAHHLPA